MSYVARLEGLLRVSYAFLHTLNCSVALGCDQFKGAGINIQGELAAIMHGKKTATT
jgi:hypothetical protein